MYNKCTKANGKYSVTLELTVKLIEQSLGTAALVFICRTKIGKHLFIGDLSNLSHDEVIHATEGTECHEKPRGLYCNQNQTF